MDVVGYDEQEELRENQGGNEFGFIFVPKKGLGRHALSSNQYYTN